MPEHTSQRYDLFVSYAEADRAWVEGYLLDALKAAGVRAHSEAAFRLGAPCLREFERAVQESQRTLLVLTPAYLAEGWNEFFRLMAQSYDLKQEAWRVIPLRLKPVALPPGLAMLKGLDGTDAADWPEVVNDLCAELERPVQVAGLAPACPYPGMVPFRAEDARFFFGRQGEIKELRQRLRNQSLLLVVGPSGSGKSSLVFAGLLPELERRQAGKWSVRELRPGAQPVEALARALGIAAWPDEAGMAAAIEAVLQGMPQGQRLLLIVDQLEELFTQAAKAEQTEFVGALKALSGAGRCAVVLTLRADFYGDLMISDLWPLDPGQRLEVAPLRGEALREAIVRPAEKVGVYLEAGLVERLLADAAEEPGVLPLVQETMALLWEEMKRRFIPLQTYEKLGDGGQSGLAVAMRLKADAAWKDLTAEGQRIGRRILLRLVQFGEGRADTSRQQTVAELRSSREDAALFAQTLSHLGDNRLLTLSGGEGEAVARVDLAHEGLIEGWPRFWEWIEERREAELIRRRLEAKAAEWEELKRKGGLLDEVELGEAERWLASPDAEELGGPSEELEALMKASRDHQEQEQQRWKQLYEEAERQRDRAERQARLATARQLAAQAQLATTSHPQRSLILAVEALRVTQQAHEPCVPAAEQALRDALAESGGIPLSGHTEPVTALAFDPHDRWLATASWDGTTRLWDLTRSDPSVDPIILPGLDAPGVPTLLLDPNGRWLAAGNKSDGRLCLWDLGSGDLAPMPATLEGHRLSIGAMAFSPDGRWLATASESDHDHPRLWDLAAQNPAQAGLVLSGHEKRVNAVAFSRDSRWLATGSHDRTVRLWDLNSEDPRASSIVLEGHHDRVFRVLLSPDGRWLVAVTGSWDESAAYVWDLAVSQSGRKPTLLAAPGSMNSAELISPDSKWLVIGRQQEKGYLVFAWDLTASDLAASRRVLHKQAGWTQLATSPDGRRLVTAGQDDKVAYRWDMTAQDSRALHGHQGPVKSIAISPDSCWLATGSSDRTVRLWDLTAPDPADDPIVLRGTEGSIDAVLFSPDGRWLVTHAHQDCRPRLWDLEARAWVASPLVLRGTQQRESGHLAISPDNRWLLADAFGESTCLWDLTAQSPPASRVALVGHTDGIHAVAISQDSRWAVTASFDCTIRLWDLKANDPAADPIILREQEEGVNLLAISSNGRWLAAGGGTIYGWAVRLWDLTSRDPAPSARVLGAHEAAVHVVAFSPSSNWLLTASWRTDAQMWDLNAEDPAANPLRLPGHFDSISRAAFSMDGRWLVAASSDGAVQFWPPLDSVPTVPPFTFRGHQKRVSVLVISADSRWLVTSSEDQTTRLWDLSAENPAASSIELCGHESEVTTAAFSPDGRWLVTGGRDGTARLWTPTSAADPCTSVAVLRGHEGLVLCLAVTADSSRLITGGEDGRTLLWHLTVDDPGGSPIMLHGHQGWVTAAAISSDDRWLVTGSRDGTTRLWKVQLDELVDLACRTAGRNLTRAEWGQHFPGQPYRKTCERWPSEG